ncbi:expressed unknown protein [Seminavis robusta]|uniref:G-protein coupled receptors family 1 profile domain-containing protein n=1 Tax=Seminavis robusta TaxID=568900 RepID=A0A9N8E655_9STRA|nr:expressed unknown protein [Seminavis robusta]|eukprot:Sro661_g183240.1 n/a (438) ;mRNA; r:41625-43155
MRQRYISYLGLLLMAASVNAQGTSSNITSPTREDGDDDHLSSGDDDYYDYYYTPLEVQLVTYLPKPFSLISLVCSYVIIREILCEKKLRGRVGGTPINRMLMAMAIGDIFFSLAYFLGLWAAPQEASFGLEGQGTVGSCTFQGFLFQLGIMVSVMSSYSLSIFYILLVCRNWRDSDLEDWEYPIHGVIWLISLGLAIYPIPLELYNSNGPTCWVDSFPADCAGDDCIRGPDPTLHQLALTSVAFAFLPLSLILKHGILIVQSVSCREHYQASTAVAKQALFYTLAFIMAYLPDLVLTIAYTVDETYHVVTDSLAYGILLPSAGTFNFLVFSRLRRMKTPEGRILRRIFFCLYCRAPMDTMTAVFARTDRGSTNAPTSSNVPADVEIIAELSTEEANGSKTRTAKVAIKPPTDEDVESGPPPLISMAADGSNDEFASA